MGSADGARLRIDIDAPMAVVWSVLVDFDAYADWNPMNRGVTIGAPGTVGSTVDLEVSWGPYERSGSGFDVSGLSVDLTNREQLTVWRSGSSFAYGDDRGLLHRAERIQLLEDLGDGRTRYHNAETMVGLLTPFVRFLGGRIQRGFEAASVAVKLRSESLHQASVADA